MAAKFVGRSLGPKQEIPGLNIQSYIRVRPLDAKEKKSPILEFGKKEITIKPSLEGKPAKVYTFDRVFDEEIKQVAVYTTVVKPMINEVIQGYNCTVFAYGQTGTGKTYTMSGCLGQSWEDSLHAGIIPRALDDLFAELSANKYEYQVSISFMELYNENLRNLLGEFEEGCNIKLIDDLEGGVMFKGLSPTPVKCKEEALHLLEKGAERKHVAATLLNVNSSRSHTILTISVNIKESALDKDVLRVGKLHLIDLAGSENVSKSGAVEKVHRSASGINKRLAEASNINRSLLTLGRVITLITENSPHIPYRESKLTRLLRDSLGGKTKTCIIGTVSPNHANLDETESTINYASKARCIKNKPEKNQTISKKEFMQVASEEILMLKRDLEALRQGDGFYISKESHEEMTGHIKRLDLQVREWYERYNVINTKYEQLKEQFSSLSEDYDEKAAEYEELDKVFKTECDRLESNIEEVKKETIVREYLIDQFKKTEKNITDQAKQCKSVLENILEQNYKLHDKKTKQEERESHNVKALEVFKADIVSKLEDLEIGFKRVYSQEKSFITDIRDSFGGLCDKINTAFIEINQAANDYKKLAKGSMVKMCDITREMKKTADESMEVAAEGLRVVFLNHYNILERIKGALDEDFSRIKNKFEKTAKEAFIMEQDLKYMLVDFNIDGEFKRFQDNLQNTFRDILKSFDPLESEMKDAIKFAVRSRESCDTAYEKVEKMKKDINELHDLLKDSYNHAEMSEIRLETVTNDLSQSKRTVENLILEQSYETEDFSKETLDKIDSLLLEQNGRNMEMATELQTVTTNLNQLESNYSNETKELRRSLKFEATNCDARVRSIIDHNQLLYSIESNVQKQFNTTCRFWYVRTNAISRSEKNIEDTLRHNLGEASDHLFVLMNHKDFGLRSVKKIQDSVKEMKYDIEGHEGTTPMKIAKEDLDYPKQFCSTAAREVLLEKFNQEQRACSEGAVCQQSGSSGNIATFRRSSSMPDVFKPEDEIDEDKENINSQIIVKKKTKKTRSNKSVNVS